MEWRIPQHIKSFDFYCNFTSDLNCSQACFTLKHDGTISMWCIYSSNWASFTACYCRNLLMLSGSYSKCSRVVCTNQELNIVTTVIYWLRYCCCCCCCFLYSAISFTVCTYAHGNSKNAVVRFNFIVCHHKKQ